MKKPAHANGIMAFESPERILAKLEGKPPRELCEIIVSLLSLEPLFTAQQIAHRSKMNVRDVRAAIKAGKMPHPLLGPGYFCFAENSKKVAASAVNTWLRSFFVSVSLKSEI